MDNNRCGANMVMHSNSQFEKKIELQDNRIQTNKQLSRLLKYPNEDCQKVPNCYYY